MPLKRIPNPSTPAVEEAKKEAWAEVEKLKNRLGRERAMNRALGRRLRSGLSGAI